MFTEKRMRSEIKRLIEGGKTRVYMIISAFIVLLFIKYLDNGFNDITVFIAMIGCLAVSHEVEKLKIVKLMMEKDK